MSTDDKPPTRVAFVYLPLDIEQFTVEGDWPDALFRGDWVYAPERDRDGALMVSPRRGGRIEFLHYYACRLLPGDNAPLTMAKAAPKGDGQDGDGHQPEPDRPTGEDERCEPRAPAESKRRGFFRRAGEHAPVQGG